MEDTTTVMVYFEIIGDTFPLIEVTEKLEIKPTKSVNKGDYHKIRLVEEYTYWSFGTGYEESRDFNEQLDKVISQIRSKKNILNQLKHEYSLAFRFTVVMNIISEESPAINIGKETIQFLSDIDAEIQFDYYIFDS